MPMPSSSHRPRFLNDASLDATAPSLAVISTVLLVVVSGIAYSIINNGKSKHPLANPPRWYQTSLSKQVEFMKEGHKIFEDAKKRYGDKPYRLLTELGECLILPAEQFVRMHGEKRLSFADSISVDFHAHLPGFSPYKQLLHENKLVQTLIRTRLTKSLNGLVEPLSTETAFAVKTIFGETSDWKVSSVTPDLLSLIARVSSRVFIGEELCRNEKWLRVAKAYAIESFSASIETTWCPKAFRFLLPLFSQRFKSVLALYREASELIDPLIQRRRQLKDEAIRKGEPAPFYDDTVEWAEIDSQGASYDPKDVQLFLSFVAIHTSTYLLTRTIAQLSNEQKFIVALRQEMVDVFRVEGMTGAALSKMKLLDSALKEAIRVVPMGSLNIRRVATADFITPDGVEIKKGDRLFVDATKVTDPNVYPDPAKYDIYRYYNMRDNAITAAKAQLVGTTAENLAFGYGVHACPGRFFAANENKLALCHLLLKYDWELCPGSNLEAYPLISTMFGLDPNVRIRYRSRKPELDLDSL